VWAGSDFSRARAPAPHARATLFCCDLGWICETIEPIRYRSEKLAQKAPPLPISMRISHLLSALVGLVLFVSATASAEVLKIVVDDTIHPITDEYIGRALAEADRNKDKAVLIELNTPGGLLDSTRKIIEKIIASPVPFIIYVPASGSRAASAGFFILESADIAAMAPGTNTGAAHPVGAFGGDIKGTMKEKVEQDATALMRSVVENRARNVQVAESAGRQVMPINAGQE